MALRPIPENVAYGSKSLPMCDKCHDDGAGVKIDPWPTLVFCERCAALVVDGKNRTNLVSVVILKAARRAAGVQLLRLRDVRRMATKGDRDP